MSDKYEGEACYGCSRKEGPLRITKKRVGNPWNRMDTEQGIFIDWIGNYRENFLQNWMNIYIYIQFSYNSTTNGSRLATCPKAN